MGDYREGMEATALGLESSMYDEQTRQRDKFYEDVAAMKQLQEM